jgi:hypothetical protein
MTDQGTIITKNSHCPCGSGLKYKKCCLLYFDEIERDVPPKMKAIVSSAEVNLRFAGGLSPWMTIHPPEGGFPPDKSVMEEGSFLMVVPKEVRDDEIACWLWDWMRRTNGSAIDFAFTSHGAASVTALHLESDEMLYTGFKTLTGNSKVDRWVFQAPRSVAGTFTRIPEADVMELSREALRERDKHEADDC